MNYHVSNYLQQMPTVRVALILLLATLLSVLITSGARADGRHIAGRILAAPG